MLNINLQLLSSDKLVNVHVLLIPSLFDGEGGGVWVY